MEYPILSVALSLLLSFWCCSEFASAYNVPSCPQIYRRFSTMHSYCQPKNQSCNILRNTVTQQEINQILDLHNSFRSVIATQQEEISDLPPASNMLLMEWDNELASVAQQYSDQCIYAHDKPSQRRVRNFGVGQNIAIQRLTGYNLKPPSPDWHFAVTDWYEEVMYFSSDMVCNFPKPTPGHGEYRHFSQLIWAKTFRVGCGYTMFQNGNTFTRLYICNYGPDGNIYGSCVYREGEACTKCPVNTQCTSGKYPGLCQRINSKAPYQPVEQPHIFYCNFMNPSKKDCLIEATGAASWYIVPALGGNYLESVLSSGQNSTIIFTKRIKAKQNAKSMCVQIVYRKGANLAEDPQNNLAKEIFVIPSVNDYTYVQNLPQYSGEAEQQFSTYNLTLQWYQATEMKISFAVPSGATSQFMNVASILGLDNDCQN